MKLPHKSSSGGGGEKGGRPDGLPLDFMDAKLSYQIFTVRPLPYQPQSVER